MKKTVLTILKFYLVIFLISFVLTLLNANGFIPDSISDVLGVFLGVTFLGGTLVYLSVKNRQWIMHFIKKVINSGKNIIGISFKKRTDDIQMPSAPLTPGVYAAISFVLAVIPFVYTIFLLYSAITLDAPSDAAAGFALFFSFPFIVILDIIAIKLGKKALKMKMLVLANVSLIIAWLLIVLLIGIVIFSLILIGLYS